MRPDDYNDIRRTARRFRDELDDLHELADYEDRAGVTVDSTEFSTQQEATQAALIELDEAIHDIIQRSDTIERRDPDTGEWVVEKTLPNAVPDHATATQPTQ